MIRSGVLRAKTVLPETATEAGTIDVTDSEYLTLYIDYTKGDEDNAIITVSQLPWQHDTDEYNNTLWSEAAGNYTPEDETFTMAATAKRPIEFRVGGQAFVKVYVNSTGQSVTGTLGIKYVAKNMRAT